MDVKRNELEAIVKANSIAGKRKILIIEDERLNRELLCEILKEKYEIFTAENGEVGLEIFEQNYKELSVVLLDMQMPICDGTEFLERTREDGVLSFVPVIVMKKQLN